MRPLKSPPPDASSSEYLEELLEFARSRGLDRVGVTDAGILERSRVALVDRRDAGLSDTMGFTFRDPIRSTDPDRAVEGARSILVGALSYAEIAHEGPGGETLDESPDENVVSARVARYARHDFYTPLRRALQDVALRLRADGFRAVVFADENDLVDREVAWRAGLGWWGKNANLLLPGAGSWFVLGSVVTTAPLRVSTGRAADGCGSCRRCLDDCPTGAIVADGVVDARRCLAWLVQKVGIFPRDHRVALGDRIYGCDDCQESCPPTVRLSSRVPARSMVEGTGPVVDVIDLLKATDEQLLDRYGRWYVPERDPRWLRRNALVILGNVAPVPVSESVRMVLHHYLSHHDPMLRAHAVWAARRLGADDLLELVRNDTHPDVVAEVSQPVPLR
ncbi:MAG: tRNA epoxyqueuosine(34) reductase QueG [Actinomycetota bacterium]|nr:tRNA epoxyqueuosine(34) reductase QueG [Actinomycetota bacterium]MDA2971470.1 tRNA epoxyqueuosine(34) reductase QueG [Actinomycetota bacterium]MDA3000747.1 tRNA epoxyqueuosine(34) reductase QueG [Actinomycetota bacterium]